MREAYLSFTSRSIQPIQMSQWRNPEDNGSEPDKDLEEVKVDDGTSNSLLFFRQTTWQRRLLNRYGNELSL